MLNIISPNANGKIANDFGDFLDCEANNRIMVGTLAPETAPWQMDSVRLEKGVKVRKYKNQIKNLSEILDEHLPEAIETAEIDLEEKLIKEWQENYKIHRENIAPKLAGSINHNNVYRKLIKTPLYIYPAINKVKDKTKLLKSRTEARLLPVPWVAQVAASCMLALIISFYIIHLTPNQADVITRTSDRIMSYPIAKIYLMVKGYITIPSPSLRAEFASDSRYGQKVLGSYIAANSQSLAQNLKAKVNTIAVGDKELLEQAGKLPPANIVVLGISYPPEPGKQKVNILSQVNDQIAGFLDMITAVQIDLSLGLDKKINEIIK